MSGALLAGAAHERLTDVPPLVARSDVGMGAECTTCTSPGVVTASVAPPADFATARNVRSPAPTALRSIELAALQPTGVTVGERVIKVIHDVPASFWRSVRSTPAVEPDACTMTELPARTGPVWLPPSSTSPVVAAGAGAADATTNGAAVSATGPGSTRPATTADGSPAPLGHRVRTR